MMLLDGKSIMPWFVEIKNFTPVALNLKLFQQIQELTIEKFLFR